MQSVFFALMDLAGFTGAAPAGGLQGCGGARGRGLLRDCCDQSSSLLLPSSSLCSCSSIQCPPIELSSCAVPPAPLPARAPAESGGKASRGRELHGTAVIPRVLSFLVQQPPATGAAGAAPGPQGIRHAATSTLLEYLVNSRPNCELLGALPEG